MKIVFIHSLITSAKAELCDQVGSSVIPSVSIGLLQK